MGGCCNRNTLAENNEAIIEKGNTIQLKVSDNFLQLEEKFEALYEKLEFPSEDTKNKWQQLPRFQYEEGKEIGALEIIEGKTLNKEERYYGFM